MFKKILVAIDPSEYSSNAVPTAIEVARRFEAEVFVVHVHEHDRGRAIAYPLMTREDAEKLVADAVETVKAAGVSADGVVYHGFIGEVPERIMEVAKEQGSDLIVMGSRGLSDVAGALLGSVAHKVIRLAQVAVLVDRTQHPLELATAGARATATAVF